VVVPSLSFSVEELAKITGVVHYEERLLCLALQLADPELRMVYVTSLTVDAAVVDYYLGFTPDPASARARLHLVAAGEDGPRPLSAKLLDRPEVTARIRALVADPERAHLLTFNVTGAERELADRLGLPLFGCPPDLAWLGSKTGSRRTARRAGVGVLTGEEDLWDLEAVGQAMEKVRANAPHARAVVVKLNNGFSGQGNAVVSFDAGHRPPEGSPTEFCAAGETWASFAAKIAAEGAIVEELACDEPLVSPSVQLRILPGGAVEVVSTHDQVLGGPRGHVYLGCRFPADVAYRLDIQARALRVGRTLADAGVLGAFGIDFLVAHGPGGNAVYLSEINLRMGGTTHPFAMARLATGGRYDVDRGELVVGGTPRAYVASDNLKHPELEGLAPAEAIARLDASGLAFDPAAAAGATLHLLGALPGHGKVGAMAVAPTVAEAAATLEEVERVLRRPSPQARSGATRA